MSFNGLPDTTTPGKFLLAYLSQFALAEYSDRDIGFDNTVYVGDIVRVMWDIKQNAGYRPSEFFNMSGNPHRDYCNGHMNAAFRELDFYGCIKFAGVNDPGGLVGLDTPVYLTRLGRRKGEQLTMPAFVMDYLENKFFRTLDLQTVCTIYQANKKAVLPNMRTLH